MQNLRLAAFLLIGLPSVLSCGAPPAPAFPKTPEGRLALQAGICAPTQRHPGRLSDNENPSCPDPGALSFPFKMVDYSLHPSDGFAGRSVDHRGVVQGSHMSGSPSSPSVTEEWGCVSPSCVAAVSELAGLVQHEQGVTGPRPILPGTTTLTIDTKGGDFTSVTVPPANKSVALTQLVELLGSMEVGYW